MLSTTQIASRIDPGLVDVTSTLGYQQATAKGTGIVLTSNGEILTNNHVINGATSVSVTDIGNGKTYKATVVGYDESKDVAVLQLTGASGLTVANIGDSSTVGVGNSVVALGNAEGLGGTPSVATGSVTALDQSITASDESSGTSEQLTGLIETNAGIQPGDSGGPLVNQHGQVVGMDTAASTNYTFGGEGNGGFGGGGGFRRRLRRLRVVGLLGVLRLVVDRERDHHPGLRDPDRHRAVHRQADRVGERVVHRPHRRDRVHGHGDRRHDRAVLGRGARGRPAGHPRRRARPGQRRRDHRAQRHGGDQRHPDLAGADPAPPGRQGDRHLDRHLGSVAHDDADPGHGPLGLTRPPSAGPRGPPLSPERRASLFGFWLESRCRSLRAGRMGVATRR